MEPKDYPYIFCHTKWGGYVAFIMSFVLVSAVVYGSLNGNGSEVSFLWLVFIAAIFFWLGWKNISDKAPALKFGPDGIWTPKLGFTPWENVYLKFERISAYKSVSAEYLMIAKWQTRKHLDSISLTSLKGSSHKLKELLQQYMRKQKSRNKSSD